MNHKNIEWSNEYGTETDSIHILSSKNFESIGKCYRISNDREPSFGWCVPRYSKDVHILDQEYCDKLMKKRQEDKKIQNLKVMPEILCVGKNKTYKSEIYIKDGNRYYLMNESARQKIHNRLPNISKWYIVGKYPKRTSPFLCMIITFMLGKPIYIFMAISLVDNRSRFMPR